MFFGGEEGTTRWRGGVVENNFWWLGMMMDGGARVVVRICYFTGAPPQDDVSTWVRRRWA